MIGLGKKDKCRVRAIIVLAASTSVIIIIKNPSVGELQPPIPG
jgi:hypothetical protein